MSCVRQALPAVLVLSAVSGCCGGARLIQSGPDGGIVAIPSNTNSWPYKYRDEAEKLMAKRCPNGYDIVKEEEAPVGRQTTTTTVTPVVYNKEGDSATATVTSTSTRTEHRITFKARPILAVPTVQIKPMETAPPLQPAGPNLPPRPIPVDPPS
jgi:hypothetical protein